MFFALNFFINFRLLLNTYSLIYLFIHYEIKLNILNQSMYSPDFASSVTKETAIKRFYTYCPFELLFKDLLLIHLKVARYKRCISILYMALNTLKLN